MIKNIYLYILLALLTTAGVPAFADNPSSSLDDKPSIDTAANAEVQVPAVPADTAAADTQTNYLYDLKKLIEKSRANIKEVNAKIKEQAVLKRNQKREERAREYYEKGVELTNEGKLDEARDYFEKAIRITEHPEMAGYIKESQRRLRKQEAALEAQEREHYHQIKEDETTRKEDVETAYREAVDLYKQKKYHPAKDAFMHVDEIAPEYRATDSYLKIIDQDIIQADAVAAKEQAVEIEKQQKEAEEARTKEKQMWLEQIEEKEKERKEAINKQAMDVYDEAVMLYKNKRYAEAKKKFEEVSWVIPDYKATMKYLARIDKDAQEEQERVEREQQKALQEQRWEETVEQKKQEAQRQKELEAKERQHMADLQEQAQFLYKVAVSFFDKNDMDGALERFNDIEKLLPGFKSTRVYIARIQQWDFDHHKNVPPPEVVAPAMAAPVAVLPASTVTQDPGQKEKELEQRRTQELKDLNDRAKKIYVMAVKSYRDHQWEESKAQFESVEQLVPDYKRTRHYLDKISDAMAREAKEKVMTVSTPGVVTAVAPPAPAAVPAPAVQSMPPQVQVAVSLEDQQKQAQDIAALAEKSAQLFHQISDIADDQSTEQTKRKMAQVDEIMRNLKESKEHILRQMQEEQWRRQQEESKATLELHRAEAEKCYQDGLEFLRSHEYEKAKIKFLELENIIPDYKSTRRYLNSIREALKKESVVAVTSYEQHQALYLKELQDKEDALEVRQAQEAEAKQRKVEQQQQMDLQTLTKKATDINDEIIALSKNQDYEGMKAKFTELENTVTALTTLKDEIAKTKDTEDREKELVKETARQRANMLKVQHQADQQMHAYYTAQPLKEYRPELSNQPNDADHYKRREIMQEQNMLFKEGVDCYEHKKYTEAKLLFGELSDQNDRRAEAWIKKVDRAITQQLLKSEVSEERERTAFIEEQVRAQRELIVIQERERQRQKQLTEELERQKRLYEDDRLLQLRKEEMMKVQERERRSQEEKRLRLEKEAERQQEALRFHKIVIVAKPQPAVVQAPPAPVVKIVPVVVPPPVTVAPAVKPAAVDASSIKAQQLQAQIAYSNARKAYFDNKYKEDQEKAREEKIKAETEARQKRIEEKQKERERQEELKSQREIERQARLKAIADARAALEKEKADRIEQERKHREEVLREQEEQRLEKIKQAEIAREEEQHRQDMERQERERQAQLEAQREAVRKQLEDGVEAMYQDALSLYNQGDYTAAADRFKDVQDILPGYKRSEQYMSQARQKSLIVKEQPPAEAVPVASANSAPVTRQDNVSKALDLFDPNAK